MFPWFFFWAPQVTLPFGGSVAQQIEPDTSWFFAGIPQDAGDPRLERKAFEIASYGRQLGLLTEVIMDLAAQTPPATAQGRKSLQRLREIQLRIEEVKDRDAIDVLEQIDGLLARLEKTHPERLAAARQRIASTLEAAHR
ncbi:hypothetical protein H8N03_24320 [Ramlibacter sp. USB13]|uniref:Uncharacterized protein n=1 Tax=Ramlibacter cellulosilyticus TaxID=2764187 RepID=A0A923SDI9_9BURK|nr:hypothetical protein [Ramlibacter cellulosilyticus]MBC5786086.1 hypothetical protein [Ramlibacter cellulosilyticus]